jgi:hypothetical protein
MGQLKSPWPQGWTGPEKLRTDCGVSPSSERVKKETQEKDAKVRYSYDGFWTTQHPVAKAFSKDWLKAHLEIIPYCWDMAKLAFSISKLCVFTIAMGTLGRAVVDAAQLYAYTRFVNEVQSFLII